MDLVTVIIPCFRQAHLLKEAIDSVSAQSYPHHETIVIDDGSPDDTAEVIRRFAHVRYTRQENQGVGAARNAGISLAKGQYLVFLDADDRLLPHHLETNLKAFHEYPDAGFVCGDYRWFGADDTWHAHDCRPSPDHYGTLLQRNFVGPPHVVMFSKRVMEEVGGFRVDVTPSEDQEIFMRIARNYPVHCHHTIVAEYRRHPEQNSLKFDVMLKSSLDVMSLQWQYVRNNEAYLEAFKQGIEFRRHLYRGG